MEQPKASSEFAPPGRASQDEIRRQTALFTDHESFASLLDAVSQPLMVLNRERQVVYYNRALAALVGPSEPSEILGLRPGELLGCTRAATTDCGCGTSRFCETCGAVAAILGGQSGQVDERECRILKDRTGEGLDLRVRATPLEIGGERFVAFTLDDISHEKRRQALERIFFHDVLNTAGSIRAITQLFDLAPVGEALDHLPMLRRLSHQLIDEIEGQREVLAAESFELQVERTPIEVSGFLAGVTGSFQDRLGKDAPRLRLESSSRGVRLVTDEVLLRRVISNMLKNALEATPPGREVSVGWRATDRWVEFWVHNPTAMSRDVQLQVFQRSFSTKGAGRGLGTYSMKLLTEQYLGGALSFTSSPEEGTTFRVRIPLSS